MESRCYLLDFECCKGMDSTFLGILAGTALELRKQTPAGTLGVCKLSERNKELIVNFGLQAYWRSRTTARAAWAQGPVRQAWKTRKYPARPACWTRMKIWSRQMSENAAKFQDVIAFLRNQVESEGENEVTPPTHTTKVKYHGPVVFGGIGSRQLWPLAAVHWQAQADKTHRR